MYRQRTGHEATSGIVHLGLEALVQENADGLYDPTIGALGDTLEQAKVPRAVIANGDGAQPVVDDPLQPYQRAAVNALMGSDGRVPAGSVSDDLLEPDPHAPFGLRTDNDAAYRAFSDAWQQGGVVLVEGSDLLRADLYSDFLTDDQARVQKQAALHRVDELVGRMLADVDPAHDAVFVVSPASPRRGSGLAVTGIRAPGVAPEFLRSATSRRNGFVYVIDIAPTILDLLGIDVPKEMEGRAMEVVHGTGARTSASTTLVHANEDAVFRDSKVGLANNVAIALAVVLALVAALVARARRRREGAVRFFALAVLGFLFATYVAEPLHFGRSDNSAAYLGFLVVASLLFAGACRLLGGRGPYRPLAIALAVTVVVHVLDLVAGARLELNTVFGYSATVGIRVAGQGNITFSQLTAAVLLLGGLAVWRRPGSTHGLRGDRHARGDAARDGGAAVRRRLRRRHRRCPGLRPVRVAAARSLDPAPHRRHPRRRAGGRGPARRLRRLPAPDATSRPTSAASSTSWSTARPATSFLTIRRKLDAEPRVVRRHQAAVGPARSSALLIWYLWRLHGGRIRPLFRSVPVDPPDAAGARGGRGARLRAQRLRRRDPGGDGRSCSSARSCSSLLTPIVRTGVDGGATIRPR